MLPVIFLGNLKSPDKQGPKRPYLSTNYTGTIFPNSVKMQIKYRLSPNLESGRLAILVILLSTPGQPTIIFLKVMPLLTAISCPIYVDFWLKHSGNTDRS